MGMSSETGLGRLQLPAPVTSCELHRKSGSGSVHITQKFIHVPGMGWKTAGMIPCSSLAAEEPSTEGSVPCGAVPSTAGFGQRVDLMILEVFAALMIPDCNPPDNTEPCTKWGEARAAQPPAQEQDGGCTSSAASAPAALAMSWSMNCQPAGQAGFTHPPCPTLLIPSTGLN